MELCDMNLAKYVRRNKEITLLNKMNLAIQMSEGLSYLHLNGCLHKDLKPSNILLKINSEGEICVKLTDIGLIKGLEDSVSQLSSKLDYAAMAWIAPELYVKPSDFTAASDVWALGCVIFFSFTGGKHPFDSPEGKSLADRATNIIKKKPHLTPLQPKNGSSSSHLNANLQILIGSVIADRTSDRPKAVAVVAELKHMQECAFKLQTDSSFEDLLKPNKPSKVIRVK